MFKNSSEYNAFLHQVAEDLGALKEAKVLKEADGSVEPLDKVALFQDLADIESSLSDAYAKLYFYKDQAIQNPQLLQALVELRKGVDGMLKKTASTMSFMGLAGDAQQDV